MIVDKLLELGQLLKFEILKLSLDYLVNFSTRFVLNVILPFLVCLQHRLDLLLVLLLNIADLAILFRLHIHHFLLVVLDHHTYLLVVLLSDLLQLLL